MSTVQVTVKDSSGNIITSATNAITVALGAGSPSATLSGTTIVNAVNARSLERPEIYEAVIPRFFMHYRKKDYRAMIDELTFKEGRLHPDTRSMKTANRLNDGTLLSAKPWPTKR